MDGHKWAPHTCLKNFRFLQIQYYIAYIAWTKTAFVMRHILLPNFKESHPLDFYVHSSMNQSINQKESYSNTIIFIHQQRKSAFNL